MRKQHINNAVCVLTGCDRTCVGREGKRKYKFTTLFRTPIIMPTFEIPAGPPVSENTCIAKREARPEDPATTTQRGSITYNCTKGGMTCEWDNDTVFLAWRATEEHEKGIELIASELKHSSSLIWRERRVFRCSCECSGGKWDYECTTQSDRKVKSKKTGCQCCLIIKKYPHTEKVLGKYNEEHDHMIGDPNLRFTKLSAKTKKLVMNMVRLGIDANIIVRGNYVFHFQADGNSIGKACM